MFNACTYCGSTQLIRGPRAGACVNVTCMKCGAQFNVLLHPGAPIVLIDHLAPPNPVLAGVYNTSGEHTQEFDCIECGRHIIVICGPETDRCAACQTMPGWINDPVLVRIIDPDREK